MTTTENKIVESTTNSVGFSVSEKRAEVKNMLEKYKSQIGQALPKFITPDRLIRVALTAINRDPNLLQCTTSSLIGSILQSAQLGLIPDGAVGEGYMISFRNNRKNTYECQFMIGYRGYITLAYRSGMVESFQARAVYANDKFEYEFGLNERLYHLPESTDKRGELTHVYAIVKLKGGGYVMDVMTKADVENIRKFSKSPNSPAWRDHYAEMAIKTACRRIAKRCPLSPEFVSAASLEEKVEILGETQGNEYLVLNSSEENNLVQEVETSIEVEVIESNQINKDSVVEKKRSQGQKAEQQVIDMLNNKD